MTQVTINTHQELKRFVSENRKEITNINGVDFKPLYPMLDVTNKHASYYVGASGENKMLVAPFKVTTKDETMTHSQAIELMKSAQTKTINREPLTELEEKAQEYDFSHGKVNGAKQMVKDLRTVK